MTPQTLTRTLRALGASVLFATLAACGSDEVTIAPYAASLTVVSGSGQSAKVNTAAANPFVVSVTDQNGAALAGAPVTFGIVSGGGSVSALSVATGANGQASVTYTTGAAAGSSIVSAAVSGLTPVTFTTTITP